MHLLLDIRFCRPESFGIAVYIRDLLTVLVPLLIQNPIYTKITLVLDQNNQQHQLNQFLPWWTEVTNSPKFQIHFSHFGYYSLAEQTWYLLELLRLKPDLVFFFSFNYPILYFRPFVYQVLDLTIIKTKPLSLRKWLAELVIKMGLKHAKHILFLGIQTKTECEQLTKLNFSRPQNTDYRPNSCIYLGINPLYLSQPSTNIRKSKIIGLNTTSEQLTKLEQLKTELHISKPYFLFVSVWRKYKNLERLIQAFEIFNSEQNNAYQLVIAGQPDPEYPEIITQILTSQQYQLGNLIQAINRTDEEVIMLQDQAMAYISPSLSEGFGLTVVEAASRGTLVICSDLPIFRVILPETGAIFFNPYQVSDITKALHQAVTLSPTVLEQMTQASFLKSQEYTWAKTAKEMDSVFTRVMKQLQK